METRIYNSQSTNFTLDNTTENFDKYEVKPTTTGITYDFGTRRRDVILRNTSYLYMLGDMKSDETALFSRMGNTWSKVILTEGNKVQYHSYTNTAPYNDAKLSVELDTVCPDLLWIKNGSTRTDHTWTINTRPTRQGQELAIHCANPAGANKIRINFGTTSAKVKGFVVYGATDDTGAASTGTAHTHESSDGHLFTLMDDTEIGINKYIEMNPETTLILRGMKKPAISGVTTYFWSIDHNIVNSAPA